MLFWGRCSHDSEFNQKLLDGMPRTSYIPKSNMHAQQFFELNVAARPTNALRHRKQLLLRSITSP